MPVAERKAYFEDYIAEMKRKEEVAAENNWNAPQQALPLLPTVRAVKRTKANFISTILPVWAMVETSSKPAGAVEV